MYSLQDGEELLSFYVNDIKVWVGTDGVRAKIFGNAGVKLPGCATAIARDWKSGKVFVGFTNGAFALYDMNDPKPIDVFQRLINVSDADPLPRRMDRFFFLGSRAYLVFVQGQNLGLFDFLELSP